MAVALRGMVSQKETPQQVVAAQPIAVPEQQQDAGRPDLLTRQQFQVRSRQADRNSGRRTVAALRPR
jgi:hypothetical protein